MTILELEIFKNITKCTNAGAKNKQVTNRILNDSVTEAATRGVL